MSIDKTLSQLSTLIKSFGSTVDVLHVHLAHITARINQTLDTFDKQLVKVSGSTNVLTGTLEQRVAQMPDNWIYITIAAGILIIIALIIVILGVKAYSVCRTTFFPRIKGKRKTEMEDQHGSMKPLMDAKPKDSMA